MAKSRGKELMEAWAVVKKATKGKLTKDSLAQAQMNGKFLDAELVIFRWVQDLIKAGLIQK